jgi:hypothetical protein
MIIYPPANQTTLMLVDQDPCEPQRVCYPCSAVLLPQQEELRRTSSKASQVGKSQNKGRLGRGDSQ